MGENRDICTQYKKLRVLSTLVRKVSIKNLSKNDLESSINPFVVLVKVEGDKQP